LAVVCQKATAWLLIPPVGFAVRLIRGEMSEGYILHQSIPSLPHIQFEFIVAPQCPEFRQVEDAKRAENKRRRLATPHRTDPIKPLRYANHSEV